MAAIIDIGSNSVRMLMHGKKTTVTTRVSEGLTATGKLSEIAIGRTLETLCGFSASARAEGEKIYAFGTEPLRAAANAQEFIALVNQRAGFDISVVSGEEEAELAFLGAVGAKGSGCVVDIGGASAEIICGSGGKLDYKKSLPLGAVRLTESSGGAPDKMRDIISASISGYGKVPKMPKVYGVAGTLTSLGAMVLGLEVYHSDLVHGTYVSKEDVSRITHELISFSGDINKIVSRFPMLKPLRAGVITAGAIFACMLFDYMDIEGLTVSESDNLEGYMIKHKIV